MKSAFAEIKAIAYEGPQSKNPLAFKHYNADEIVEGRTMREHLRFAVVYWHTFRGTGSDPFGMGTMKRKSVSRGSFTLSPSRRSRRSINTIRTRRRA